MPESPWREGSAEWAGTKEQSTFGGSGLRANRGRSGDVVMKEGEVIARLREIFKPAVRLAGQLKVGIGDDAAVFSAHDSLIATSTDIVTENVHFNRSWSDAKSIGRKVAIANIADIFAMGMKPNFLLVSATIAKSDTDSLFEIARGIQVEAERVDAQVIGGDLSLGDRLTVSITAFGEGERCVLRSGAEPGDDLYLTALPGRSLMGLTQLHQGISVDQECINFHLVPERDWESFERAGKFAKSMIDISDGVAKDAREIARSSRVCIEIESQLVMKHPDFVAVEKLASKLGLDVLTTILESGEEHTPLFTASPNDRSEVESFAHRIGRVTEGAIGELLLDGDLVEVKGFDHFS